MLDVERLKEFGIDARAGLQRCMNNKVFFGKMLAMGLKNDSFDKLEKSLAEGNLDASFEYAHGIKGVVGNLAITPIYDGISDLTERLRRKEDVDYLAIYKPVKELRDRLLAEL